MGGEQVAAARQVELGGGDGGGGRAHGQVPLLHRSQALRPHADAHRK